VIVSFDTISVPYTEKAYSLTVERLGTGTYKVSHVTMRVGYRDKLDVPEILRMCRKQGLLERNLDLEHASYFLSRIAITPSDHKGMANWRKKLFMTMARNAASPIDHFGLPGDRTVIMGSQVEL
jgi:KUP system potassium uptake protein